MTSYAHYDEYLQFALKLAKECAAIARAHQSATLKFEPKGDNSPVTKADIEINRLVIERCQAAYPEIDVLGEEESTTSLSESDKLDGSNSKLLWVCDPIDGTTPYVLGMSASTFGLALVEDGLPVVGVVYDFMNDRLYHAIKGQGAFLNNQRIVRPDYAPMKLLNFEWWSVQAIPLKGVHERFFAKNYQVINYASNMFMSMQVATGRVAATVYCGIYAWDIAPAKVIVEECGGIVKNLDGGDQRYDGDIKGVIVSNTECYDEILGVIQESRVSA
jgi:fructose-1,6-bisphosphatase/inositol monophosphatase family enzyme